MALIKCPECGREISDRAAVCMGCGISKEDIQAMFSENMEEKTRLIEQGGNDRTIECTDKEGYSKIVRFIEFVEKEFTGYPTVAYLTGSDRKMYAMGAALRWEVKCDICRIKYDSKVYASCPLCEFKKRGQDNQFMAPRIKSGVVQNSTSGILQNAKSMAVSEDKINRKCTARTEKYGSIIKYGKFDSKPIEWMVLDEEDDKLLIVSRDGLDAKPYNSKWESAVWEKCTLRKWLNKEFFDYCFNEYEKEKIIETTIMNSVNSDRGLQNCRNTNDRIFLLSLDEVENLFEDATMRQCKATDYAKSQGADVDDKDMSWWWLRSSGNKWDNNAAYVDSNGDIVSGGHFVGIGHGTVRPAMWISMK